MTNTGLRSPAVRKLENAVARGRLLVGRATSHLRMLPDFLIIGAQKGGTTSLYKYLGQHPDFAPALRKEVHFFSGEYERGLAWYRAFFPTRARSERHLRATGVRLQTGEATPYYLFHPLAARRVRADIPDARLIVVLRDPVKRAFSHYQHTKSRGQESLSFADALEAEAERLAPAEGRAREDESDAWLAHKTFSYMARGCYAAQIEEWLRFFDRSQFLFLKSEDLYAKPEETLDRTREFLGLRPFPWRASKVFNRGNYSAGMEPAVEERLKALYGPQNRRLRDLLGDDFDWGY
jgi:hypothetical protein